MVVRENLADIVLLYRAANPEAHRGSGEAKPYGEHGPNWPEPIEYLRAVADWCVRNLDRVLVNLGAATFRFGVSPESAWTGLSRA